jgi:hypothetical protein
VREAKNNSTVILLAAIERRAEQIAEPIAEQIAEVIAEQRAEAIAAAIADNKGGMRQAKNSSRVVLIAAIERRQHHGSQKTLIVESV